MAARKPEDFWGCETAAKVMDEEHAKIFHATIHCVSREAGGLL